MSVGFRDLDQTLAERLNERASRVWTPPQHASAEELERRAALTRLFAPKGAAAIAVLAPALAAGLTVGALSAAALSGNGAASGGLGFISGWVTFCLSIPLSIVGNRNSLSNRLAVRVSGTELLTLADLLSLTEIEKVYISVAALLADQPAGMSDTVVQEILGDINSLLKQHRQLNRQREDLLTAMGSSSVVEMETKRSELLRLSEETSDAVARSAVSQSLEMLQERLHAARSLQPGLERVSAQLEVIEQTLASVQGALARLKVAPAPISSPQLEDLRVNISQVTGQSRAVEEAVQEVMSLGARG
jgi:hypothetical protein